MRLVKAPVVLAVIRAAPQRLWQAARWLFLLALAVVIWGELKPTSPGPPLVWDKLLHFTAYFGLAALATAALAARLRPALWAGFALALFGGILEIVQGFVGRDAEWGDEIANIIGVCAGLGAALLIWRAIQRLERRRQPERRGK